MLVLGNLPVTCLNIHVLPCLIGSRVQAHARVYRSPGGVNGLRNADMFLYILLQGMSTDSSLHLLSPDIAVVNSLWDDGSFPSLV